MIRIVTGLILLHTHLSTLPDLLDFIGPHAWIDAQGLTELHRLASAVTDLDQQSSPGGARSIWFHVQDARLISTLHAIFLVAVGCFTLGLFSRTASVIVWAGHLSYVQRAVVITYGLDTILSAPHLDPDGLFNHYRDLGHPPSAAPRHWPPDNGFV